MLLKKIDCYDLDCYKGGGGTPKDVKGYRAAEKYLKGIGLANPSNYSFDLYNSNPLDRLENLRETPYQRNLREAQETLDKKYGSSLVFRVGEQKGPDPKASSKTGKTTVYGYDEASGKKKEGIGVGKYEGDKFAKGWSDRIKFAEDSVKSHMEAKQRRDALAEPKTAEADVELGTEKQTSTGFEDFIVPIDSGEITNRGEANAGLGENVSSKKNVYAGLGIK